MPIIPLLYEFLLHSFAVVSRFEQKTQFSGSVRLRFCASSVFAETPASAATKGSKSRQAPCAYSAERSQTRKAKLARARAVAMAREMADTALPRYKVDASGDLVPDVRAAAAIIYDPDTNEVLWEENSQSQRSIASITKVMTATVFLENNPDLTQPVTIARSDVFQASTTHLHANDKVTTDDLLHLLLIASDNAAARALARVSPQGSEGFIRRMNEKAAELGLRDHALRGSVRPAVGERLVGLRHGAPHHARVAGRAHLVDHAHLRVHGLQRRKRPITFHSTNHLLRGARRRRARGEDRLHLEGRLLPGDACCACRRAASKSRSSSSARARTPAGSWNRAICSTGSRRRPRRSSRRKPATPQQ